MNYFTIDTIHQGKGAELRLQAAVNKRNEIIGYSIRKFVKLKGIMVPTKNGIFITSMQMPQFILSIKSLNN